MAETQVTETPGAAWYGPCGHCGLVHSSGHDCSGEPNAACRLIEIGKLVDRVSRRNNIAHSLDISDLATVLLLCTAPRESGIGAP